jgi:photosystem II stability/assembly factor-like uncharacterized protein
VRGRRAIVHAGSVWMALALGLVVMPQAAGAATPSALPRPSPPPSAIGNEVVSWLAVSSNYGKTGTVVAVADQRVGCSKDCHHLWITGDRGQSWRRAAATSWDGKQPSIAVDTAGHEVMFDSGASGAIGSEDLGETWTPLGVEGFPSASPNYASDATIAVAGKTDHLLTRDGNQLVAGSGGALVDQRFALVGAYPNGGSFSPALLAAVDGKLNPVIQRCDAQLRCSGDARLPGIESVAQFAAPATLMPSADYGTEGVVFAHTARGIFKSTDGGSTFVQLAVVQSPGDVFVTPMMALAPGYSERGSVHTLYVALLEPNSKSPGSEGLGGVVRSTDGGASWGRVAPGGPLDRGALAVAVAPDGRIFAGYLPTLNGYAGLLCSPDGKSWQATCSSGGGGGDTGFWARMGAPGYIVLGAVVVLVVLAVGLLWLRQRPRPAAIGKPPA